MFSKIRLISVVAIVCAIIGLLVGTSGIWLHGRTERKDGQLLSERDMAAVFGDNTTNNLCMSKQNCTCTREGAWNGQRACLNCNNDDNTGNLSTWFICCANNDTACQETGGGACGDLFIFVTTSYDEAADCCQPCRGTLKNTGQACGTRKNAVGDAC